MNERKNIKSLFYSLCLLTTLFLSACSTVTTTEGMTPDLSTISQGNKHQGSLSLMVSGEARGITVDNFKQALFDAILTNEVFEEINDRGTYLLEVKINHVSQPMFGAGFTISMKSTWKLFRMSDREIVWSKEVDSNYEGGALEGGLIGVNRYRVAVERSARDTIQQGVSLLSQIIID